MGWFGVKRPCSGIKLSFWQLNLPIHRMGMRERPLLCIAVGPPPVLQLRALCLRQGEHGTHGSAGVPRRQKPDHCPGPG